MARLHIHMTGRRSLQSSSRCGCTHNAAAVGVAGVKLLLCIGLQGVKLLSSLIVLDLVGCIFKLWHLAQKSTRWSLMQVLVLDAFALQLVHA
jgi:hypothetical protein